MDDERDLEQLAAGGEAFLLMVLGLVALATALAVSTGGYLYRHHWTLALVLLTCSCLWGSWKLLAGQPKAPRTSEDVAGGSVKP